MSVRAGRPAVSDGVPYRVMDGHLACLFIMNLFCRNESPAPPYLLLDGVRRTASRAASKLYGRPLPAG